MSYRRSSGALSARAIVNFGVEGLITGNITPDAASVLQAGSVKVYKQTWGTVRDGIEQFESGRLSEGGPTCFASSVSINGRHSMRGNRRVGKL